MSLGPYSLVLRGPVAPSLNASDRTPNYFECNNLANIKDMSVQVDLLARTATFVSDEVTSTLKLIGTEPDSDLSNVTCFIFEGANLAETGWNITVTLDVNRRMVSVQQAYQATEEERAPTMNRRIAYNPKVRIAVSN